MEVAYGHVRDIAIRSIARLRLVRIGLTSRRVSSLRVVAFTSAEASAGTAEHARHDGTDYGLYVRITRTGGEILQRTNDKRARCLVEDLTRVVQKLE